MRFKTFLSLLLLGIVFLVEPAMAKEKKNARMELGESTFDFGSVSVQKGRVSHEFTFTNAGEKNLIITDARADCGCTRPEYSEAPVAPGKSGKIKVTFVPNGKGFFSKKVTVTTNGSPRKIHLIIKGEVVP